MSCMLVSTFKTATGTRLLCCCLDVDPYSTQTALQVTLMTLTCGLASGAAQMAKKGRSMLSIPRIALGWAILTGLMWAFAIIEALKVSPL